MTLNEFFLKGPFIRRGDRVRCEKRWKAILALPDGLNRVLLARMVYEIEVSGRVKRMRQKRVPEHEIAGWILHLSTFLGRWEDYMPEEERTEAIEDDSPAYHVCEFCTPRHRWTPETPDTFPERWPCAEAMAMMKKETV